MAAKKCVSCQSVYTLSDVFETLEDMGFAPGLWDVDGDYLFQIYDLCPACWPEYVFPISERKQQKWKS